MVYDVIVVPKSKHKRVMPTGERELKVYITEPPVEGKANTAVVNALKSYFHVPKSHISIIRGYRSRNKRIAVTPV